MLVFLFLFSVQVKMGSSSHLITTSMMDSTAKENSSKPKKFSPFSVDSLLATKVKQQQSDQPHHHHHQLDNNNTKTEPKLSITNNVNKQLTSADSNSTTRLDSNVVDLSLKKEESSNNSGNSIADEDQEEDCDNESELDDDLIDDECDDVEDRKTPESVVFGTGSPILVPHPRFPALGLNLASLPHHPPTSGWNSVVSPHPWMPQFRSPLNPFIPREQIFFFISQIFIYSLFMALCVFISFDFRSKICMHIIHMYYILSFMHIFFDLK